METVFINYSHKDEDWKDRVMTHLGVLEKAGHLKLWNDRDITVGSDWYSRIETELNRARVVVMLITANFLTSDFIQGEEVPRILQRRKNEGVLVIPVIVKPCAWKAVDGLSAVQLFPKDGIPLSTLEESKADAEMAAAQPGPVGGALCIITTRQAVADLAPRRGFAVKEILLDHLSEAAGVELLKNLGVTTGSAQDFRQAVKEYNGHALALTLLGNYIKSVHQGDLRQRDEIRQLTEGQGREYLHAGRVIAAYEKWFGPSPQRDILYILGLFDRPVKPGAIAALRKAPAIPGVTDRLQNLSEKDWQWAMSHLREAGLVAGSGAHKNMAAALDTGTLRPIRPTGPGETTGTIDSHPLTFGPWAGCGRQSSP